MYAYSLRLRSAGNGEWPHGLVVVGRGEALVSLVVAVDRGVSVPAAVTAVLVVKATWDTRGTSTREL